MEKLVLLGSGINRVRGIAREGLYMNSGIDITAPESIRGMVNERCNYRCRYCSCWQQNEYVEEMSIAEWKQALVSLKQFIGTYLIQFSGGEPFIKKGFVDLLQVCHDQDIAWGVITNGSALNSKNVAAIVAAKPCNIDISLDSADAAVNDSVRGAPGSLEAISRGMKCLLAERAATAYRFPIRLKPTISRLTYRGLPELVTWAVEHGADTIDFAPVRPIYELYWTEAIDAELWIRQPEINDLAAVIETLIEMKKAGAPIETPSEKLRSFPEHFLRRRLEPGLAPCRVGMRDFHIHANGDVHVCWEYPPIGNVRLQSAREIWKGARAQEIRAQTVACTRFGTIRCATSCLSHRTITQEMKRALLLVRQMAL